MIVAALILYILFININKLKSIEETKINMRAFEKITALLVIIVTYVLQYVKADCPPGTYGNDGNCKICPPNYYCPGNTAQPFQCPPGYTSFDGEASCYEMTHSELEYRLNRNLFSCGSQYGYYCSGSSSVECSAGNYCPANGAQYACPQGNYCPLNLKIETVFEYQLQLNCWFQRS